MTRRVIVLGGGISGLAVAHFLSAATRAKNGGAVHVRLVEQAAKCGGWMQTVHTPRFQFERGTRSLTAKPHNVGAMVELLTALGIGADDVVDAHTSVSNLNEAPVLTVGRKSPVAQTRYLLHQDRVTQVPSHPIRALWSPLTRTIPLALMRDLVTPRRSPHVHDESVDAFFRRRFNASVAREIMGAFVHGIYGGGDATKWSLQSLFPRMHSLERRHRSILLGSVMDAFGRLRDDQHDKQGEDDGKLLLAKKLMASNIFAFRDGMEELPRLLHAQLERQPNVELSLGEPCTSLSINSNGGFTVRVGSNGTEFHADTVVSTLPAFSLAKIYSPLAPLLEKIPFNSVAVVNYGFTGQQVIKHLLPSIGFLVPGDSGEHDGCPATGVIFDHFCFPHRQPPETSNGSVLTVILGGQHFVRSVGKPVTKCTPAQLDIVARGVLKKYLDICTEPDATDIAIQHQAFPQYHVGHSELMQQLRANCPPRLLLTGASYNGVGVPDCISNSHQIAREILYNK